MEENPQAHQVVTDFLAKSQHKEKKNNSGENDDH